MLPFKPPLRILVAFVAVSSAFLYLALFRRDLAYLAAKTLPLSNPDKLPPGTDLDDKTTFIQAFLDHEIDGPFNPVPIQKVCAAQKWNPDLTILCGAPQGGLGNVRNVFLTCIRYAMEAGGAFVIPDIMARDSEDLSNLNTNDTVPFDHFFDRSYLTSALKSACPQMAIHDHPPTDATPVHVSPQSLVPEVFAGSVLLHPEQWRPNFDAWLAENAPGPGPKSILFATPLLNYPVHSDSAAFGASFGRLLRIREPARRLAAAACYTMRSQHGVPITPVGVSEKAFFGAHLRVAADAAKAGWTSYEAQAAFLFDFAKEAELSTLYVTSESEPAKTFRTDAKARGVTVFAKEDLLTVEEKARLDAMTWDQQALVDFEVLLRATMFGGIELSSFAWNVALRRHVLSRRGRKAWDEVEQGGGLNMQDEYSRLRGEKGAYLLFLEAMWP